MRINIQIEPLPTVDRERYARRGIAYRWRLSYNTGYGALNDYLLSPDRSERVGYLCKTKAEAEEKAKELREQYRPYKKLTKEQYEKKFAENVVKYDQ